MGRLVRLMCCGPAAAIGLLFIRTGRKTLSRAVPLLWMIKLVIQSRVPQLATPTNPTGALEHPQHR